MGKGLKGKSFCIPFEGSEQTVKELLDHLNSKACLEQAKAIFEKNGNFEDLKIVVDQLKKYK